MRLHDNHDDRIPDRSLSVPSRDNAANVVRSQIDAIYHDQGATTGGDDRKHQSHSPHGDHWQKYHTAWQEYYQKYYERYYTTEVHKYLQQQESSPRQPDDTQDKDKATTELKRKLLSNVERSAKKARKSRHFIPIVAGFVTVFVVAFLQYNQLIISSVQAYVSPGSINPQNIVVDPTANDTVGPDPKLIIPKINVDVPVVYGVGFDQKSQLKAMEKGVAHFAIPGASSVPGQIGNTVIAGHSSNDLFEPGDYKFIFVQLEKLQNGDTIYANYQGKRYTYVVTKKEVVLPNNVQALIYPTNKPVMTLITCVPIGTADKRLLVTAEQISPDPSKASDAPAFSSDDKARMPGTAPTIIERIFGSG